MRHITFNLSPLPEVLVKLPGGQDHVLILLLSSKLPCPVLSGGSSRSLRKGGRVSGGPSFPQGSAGHLVQLQRRRNDFGNCLFTLSFQFLKYLNHLSQGWIQFLPSLKQFFFHSVLHQWAGELTGPGQAREFLFPIMSRFPRTRRECGDRGHVCSVPDLRSCTEEFLYRKR